MYKLIFFFLGLTILFSCNEPTKTVENKNEIITKTKYTLTPFANSTDYSDATIKKMTYKNGNFDFTLTDGNYELGQQTPDADSKMCANSGKGQHIHLIVDDKPYAAKYTNSFEYSIEDGEYHLLAFLSRSYHESIKTGSANYCKQVSIKNGYIIDEKEIEETMIFYSRPKGTYVGKDTEKIMLDFYLKNSSLKNGEYVVAKINGEEHKIDQWTPYYIEGLPMGENTIQLSLFDSKGTLLKTPLNPVSRTFTLKADPEPK